VTALGASNSVTEEIQTMPKGFGKYVLRRHGDNRLKMTED
jgi:hypothetical protein